MPTDLPPEPEPEPPALERPGRREPLVVREHEDIVLTATRATPCVATVTWLKDGVEIRRSKRHQTASLGDTHTLTIHSAQTLDSAVYSCRVDAEVQDFPVQVEGQQGWGRSSGNPVCAGGGRRTGVSPVRSCRQHPCAEPEGDSGPTTAGHRACPRPEPCS